MKLNLYFLIFGLTLLSIVNSEKNLEKKKKQSKTIEPNIILIMADDMGYGDIGCFGSDFNRTPVLDRIASEGMRFTDFHSNGAVCTPTRAALLTGNYQQRSGLEMAIWANERDYGLPHNELTISKILQKNGYSTGIYGKWHLGFPAFFKKPLK